MCCILIVYFDRSMYIYGNFKIYSVQENRKFQANHYLFLVGINVFIFAAAIFSAAKDKI